MKTKLPALVFSALFFIIFFRESYPSRIWSRLYPDVGHKSYTQYDNMVDLFRLIDSCKLVLVGNSIIDRAPWEVMLKDGTCNMGISGDITSKMLERFDLAIKTKPEKLIFCGGVNDVIAKVNPELTISNIKSMLTAAIDANVEVFFQPILPVSKEYPDYDRINSTSQYINLAITRFCEELNCNIIDLTHLFVRNENGILTMPQEYTVDGLHPNSNLYVEWRKVIMGKLN